MTVIEATGDSPELESRLLRLLSIEGVIPLNVQDVKRVVSEQLLILQVFVNKLMSDLATRKPHPQKRSLLFLFFSSPLPPPSAFQMSNLI